MKDKSLKKKVLNLALPAVGEMILYMMLGVMDTMMVGKHGGKFEVSAVGLSTEIIYTFTNILLVAGICVGITSLISRAYGSKNIDLCEKYSTLGFLIGGLISFLISFSIFIFAEPLLKIAGCKDNILTLGMQYTKIACIGIFFYMLTSIINSILRACRNTKTPLFVAMISNGLNIMLDYILIFGIGFFPELGVKGAALASTISQIAGFIFVIIYMSKHSSVKIRLFSKNHYKLNSLSRLINLSIPASLQEAAFGLSRLTTTFFIMYLGATSFSANQIATTIESISYMPGWGFAVAATTLVGNSIGEGDLDRAKTYAKECTLMGTILMTIFSIIFLIIPHTLIGIFINHNEIDVIKLGSLCLIAAAFEQPTMAISMILGGSLKGSGDTKTPFIVSLLSSWVIRVPLTYYFIYLKKYSVVVFWYIACIQWAIDALLMYILYKKRIDNNLNNIM